MPDCGEASYAGSGKLAGRKAVITGGDSGIGRAVAIAYAREGADVLISYLDEHDDAEATARLVRDAGRTCVLMPGDIRDHGHCQAIVQRAVDELGGVDLLVNNAAFQMAHKDLQDFSPEELDRTFRTNVFATFFLTQAAVQHMPAGSNVINTASINADKPNATLVAYAATKGALQNLTGGFAQLLADKGIRVNCVAPGPVWTPLIPSTLEAEKVRGMAASNPIPDGWVLAQDPIAAVRAGRYLRMPVLAGHTRDEAKLFPQLFALRPALGGASGRLLDDAAVFTLAARYDPEAAPQTTLAQWIPPTYLPVDAPGTGFDARARQLDALWFSAIRDDMLNALRTQQETVWAYEFEWDRLPPPLDRIFGAAHTFDLPFVFGNFGPSLYARFMVTRANAPGRLALSDAMMRSLGALARRGDPNDAGLGARWPAWPERLVFDADLERTAIRVR